VKVSSKLLLCSEAQSVASSQSSASTDRSHRAWKQQRESSRLEAATKQQVSEETVKGLQLFVVMSNQYQ
jgi:hypothetical protein